MPGGVKDKFSPIALNNAVTARYAELAETEISGDSLHGPYRLVGDRVHPGDLLPPRVRRAGRSPFECAVSR